VPPIGKRHIGIAFDMYGCPNACRHCYLGKAFGPPMSEEDVRWAVAQFRKYTRQGDTAPFFQKLTVTTWLREPDYADDYRRLYNLEDELSDGRPARSELLSIWRLARDVHYARWAKEVGPDTCQISFFGLEETNDWFHRRQGAFRDNLAATERLLEAGMKPRWQFFLTRKILPELSGLMRLIGKRRLRERVADLGGRFDFFIHTPGPDYEGRRIEDLRPTLDEIGNMPAELIEASKRHFGRETLWRSEAELYAAMMNEAPMFPYAHNPIDMLWFFVTNRFDVFSNLGTLEPWWLLGNLRKHSVAAIADAFENNRPLALKTTYTVPARELAREFGDPASTRVYGGADDLKSLYLAQYCETKCSTI